MTIDIPLTFELSPALAKAAILYERYFETATASPFDEKACASAFSDWEAAMESVFYSHIVVPLSVTFAAPRPPDVTDEDIAKFGQALARGYLPVSY